MEASAVKFKTNTGPTCYHSVGLQESLMCSIQGHSKQNMVIARLSYKGTYSGSGFSFSDFVENRAGSNMLQRQ